MAWLAPLIAVAAGAAAPSTGPTAGELDYRVVTTLPGPDGGFDYLSVDSASARLFVAREYGVMAVDLASGIVTRELVAGADDSAVLVLPGTNEMLSTNWARHTATLFDRTNGAIRATVATGKGPDGALYDPASRLVYVMNSESRDVSVIDASQAAVVTTIALDAKPEAATADGSGRVFVNLEDVARIAVIDTHDRRVRAHFELPGCVEPTGLAFDPVSRVLVSACHNGVAKLIDSHTGVDRGTVAIGRDADGAVLDLERRVVAVPGADGVLTIFRLDATGRAGETQSVQTTRGARTIALDPATGRLYLASTDDQHRGFRVWVVAP